MDIINVSTNYQQAERENGGFNMAIYMYIGVFYDADGDNPASFRDDRRKTTSLPRAGRIQARQCQSLV